MEIKGHYIVNKFVFAVTNTTKIFGSFFLHWGKVVKGTVNIGDQVTASINAKKRNLIRNNHSATHLLHESLRQILGNHVTQKGSLVNDEKLRFDFNHNDPIDNIDLEKIEKIVNKIILQKSSVTTEILNQQSAIHEGAIALFGEKYEDEVRVITMGTNSDNYFFRKSCAVEHMLRILEILKNLRLQANFLLLQVFED